MFKLTERFLQLDPPTLVGVLALENLTNPAHSDDLDLRKQAIEQDLRQRYSGFDRPGLRELPVLQAYHQFYRRFDKTYHVQLQLESIVFKHKSIPSIAALVESMFMAELKNFLLTAGHDLDKTSGEMYAEVAQGNERFTQLNGKEVELKPGDLFIADQVGILSSVLYGPDQRSAIHAQTTRAVFTVYAPSGIERDYLQQHLDDIEDNIRLFAPAAQVLLKEIYP